MTSPPDTNPPNQDTGAAALAIIARDRLSRQAMATLLRTYGFPVAASAATVSHLARQAAVNRMRAVVLAAEGDLMETCDAVRILRRDWPRAAVVVVAARPSEGERASYRKCGAAAVIERDAPPIRLVRCLEIVTEPEGAAEGTVVAAPAPDLAPGDAEILALLATGATNRQVAAVLRLPESAVAARLRVLRLKTRLRNRTQLALWSCTMSADGGGAP
ncbi:helix-turn-helix transcriptional regulator [Azospirillum sp.]|uniref:helix-turn-helix transcriptional regulator n=1 Tax=Azospirillum sp. TaxID=34012 RepID=UPI002D4EC3B0|nr:LuxR C-terminal-related transcriptional regulator [Azospirillum sp.]HYD67079.1 LuxR C-terminal-related transcriptional regulator [Azospirillum sp.]